LAKLKISLVVVWLEISVSMILILHKKANGDKQVLGKILMPEL
jgi:hypothetical protein